MPPSRNRSALRPGDGLSPTRSGNIRASAHGGLSRLLPDVVALDQLAHFDQARERVELAAVRPFLTSSSTSYHPCCSAPLTSVSSWRRVSSNRGSWCHSSQSARLFQVPPMTRFFWFSS